MSYVISQPIHPLSLLFSLNIQGGWAHWTHGRRSYAWNVRYQSEKLTVQLTRFLRSNPHFYFYIFTSGFSNSSISYFAWVNPIDTIINIFIVWNLWTNLHLTFSFWKIMDAISIFSSCISSLGTQVCDLVGGPSLGGHLRIEWLAIRRYFLLNYGSNDSGLPLQFLI